MKNPSLSHSTRALPTALTALTLLCQAVPPLLADSLVATGSLTTPRFGHTATLLANGKVLAAGGTDNTANTSRSAELYDPATGLWAPTGPLGTDRSGHTATLLPNGQVLIVGGFSVSVGHYLPSAELYDPVSGGWMPTLTTLNTARGNHTATLLNNGLVLVAGGSGPSGAPLASAELYNPANGLWSTVGSSMTDPRMYHTASLLPDGTVVLAAGMGIAGSGSPLLSAEVYNPNTGQWALTDSMDTGNHVGRFSHTATLGIDGKAMVVGGIPGNNCSFCSPLTSAESYTYSTRLWEGNSLLSEGRAFHTATLLPNGSVVVTGGGGSYAGNDTYFSVELEATPNWQEETWFSYGNRFHHTATILPGGRVLIAGGADNSGHALSDAFLYDLTSGGFWTTTGAMTIPRQNQTATLLPNGKVLVAGNSTGNSSAELYDGASWTAIGPMSTPRSFPTATLLASGQVLVAGGGAGAGGPASAELYDPASGPLGSWAQTGSMTTGRSRHTATLLLSGTVLVAGGSTVVPPYLTSSAELYDPMTGAWTPTGPLATPRYVHTAILLPSGKVLVTGGADGTGTSLNSVEWYDPVSRAWSPAPPMSSARVGHTATLLPSGKVLVAGGGTTTTFTSPLASAELYDPTTGQWQTAASMNTARQDHTATLLLNGQVLVAGGDNIIPNSSAELYDPATGTWTTVATLHTARYSHSATLLPSGKVLVAGGHIQASPNVTATAELYDVLLGFSSAWQPQITSLSSLAAFSGSLALAGSQFRGVSEGSDGTTQNSPTGYPVVQLRSLANEQTTFVQARNWSATSFLSGALPSFAPGYMLVTVFANGIPSTSSFGAFALSMPRMMLALSGGNAVLSWSINYPGYVLETTPSLNPAAWTVVPGTPATINGQYVISVGPATGSRFFRLAADVAQTALSFDGASTYVSVGATALPTPWTAEFWVNRQDTPSISASLLGDASTALKLEQFNTARHVGFTRFGVADYAFNYTAPANTWVHLAFVSDTTTRLYVNGVLQDSNPTPIPLPLGRIGFDTSGHADYLRGILDEIRVWNVARTPAQLQAGMNHPLAIPQANLVGYWKFDEGTGASASDSSGQGKTGTLQNGPVWVISSAPIVP